MSMWTSFVSTPGVYIICAYHTVSHFNKGVELLRAFHALETRRSPGTAGPAVGWPGEVQRFLVWRPLTSLVMRRAVIA